MRFFFFILIGILLSSCYQPNLLAYRWRQIGYSEGKLMIEDADSITLEHTVYYKNPIIFNKRDFKHQITLVITDTTAAQAKKILDLEKDTAIVKGYYQYSTEWSNYLNDTTTYLMGGQVEIIFWNKNRITIMERLNVVNTRNHVTRFFQGKRTFRRN